MQVTGFAYCNNISSSERAVLDSKIACGRGTDVPRILVYCIVAFALLYFAITWILLVLKLKGYRKQHYSFVQVGLVYNTLQVSLITAYHVTVPLSLCSHQSSPQTCISLFTLVIKTDLCSATCH